MHGTVTNCCPWHVFLTSLDGKIYRCSAPLDDAAFERLMDALQWKMPYNLRAFHCSNPAWIDRNPVLQTSPALSETVEQILASPLIQTMRLKDKQRQLTLPVRYKHGSCVIADTEDGYGRFYRVDGRAACLVARLIPAPITLREASAYMDRRHRHNAGPSFHKFSVCLRVDGEPEPVGVAVASTSKARHQMDGETLEINRCCADTRYADVCSSLYARAIRIGRELGYCRFITYTLPEESGSSLRAVGFHLDGVVKGSTAGWDSISRPRNTERYPAGEKLRWVIEQT